METNQTIDRCSYEQELKLPGDTLEVQVRKAKLSALGAAKYVMQMGLTASNRLDEAAAGNLGGASLAHSRKQVSPSTPLLSLVSISLVSI